MKTDVWGGEFNLIGILNELYYKSENSKMGVKMLVKTSDSICRKSFFGLSGLLQAPYSEV